MKLHVYCLKQKFILRIIHKKHKLRLPLEASLPSSAITSPSSLNARENTVEGRNMQSQTMNNSKDERFGPKELNMINPIT